MSLSWHEIYPAKIVSALLFRWSQMPTIRSLPIFSHPFPERFSIGTTLWCGWIQIRPVFSDLKILCASCRWAFVIFHRLKQFEHHMRRPTHPVKLDDLRGVENKTQEKGLKPQHQVTPLTWNPKKNDDVLETGNLLLHQNLIFQLKLLSKLHRCILGRFPGEKSNRWTCHWKVGKPSSRKTQWTGCCLLPFE